jgi:hypothetical protein
VGHKNDNGVVRRHRTSMLQDNVGAAGTVDVACTVRTTAACRGQDGGRHQPVPGIVSGAAQPQVHPTMLLVR